MDEPAFQHLQACFDWLRAQLDDIEAVDLVSGTHYSDSSAHKIQLHPEDVEIAQGVLTRLRELQQVAESGSGRLNSALKARDQLPSHDLMAFDQLAGKSLNALKELRKTSQERLRVAESLVRFLGDATEELNWLKACEQAELSRDWSCSEAGASVMTASQLDAVQAHSQVGVQVDVVLLVASFVVVLLPN